MANDPMPPIRPPMPSAASCDCTIAICCGLIPMPPPGYMVAGFIMGRGGATMGAEFALCVAPLAGVLPEEAAAFSGALDGRTAKAGSGALLEDVSGDAIGAGAAAGCDAAGCPGANCSAGCAAGDCRGAGLADAGGVASRTAPAAGTVALSDALVPCGFGAELARRFFRVAASMARQTFELTPCFMRSTSASVETSKSVSETSMILVSVSSSKWFWV